ncbi:MAG: efflux RND transporter periplasmic adaptor subunit [Chthoniobacteraceae bacterium]|jgi:putative peptide zinc metalloprotease protein
MAATAAPHPPPQQAAHAVIPPLRSDLIVIKQFYEGRTFYVVKDPISLQYFRLTAEDYFLATLFDGKRDMRRIQQEYVERFPHLRLDFSEEEISERLSRFANDLGLLQFLTIQGVQLKPRYDAIKRAKKHGKGGFYTFVNNMFFFRRSIFDPDKLFSRMAKPLWWIWTRQSLWISICMVVAATIVVYQKYDATGAMMSRFFSLNNIALIWVTTIIIKSIHELGHGLTCKHFGGEVHEVGVMLLVFTPYFFVNVSDCWVLPDRNKRILISAAGIYVELVLASLATFLWAVVQPGAFQQILWNIMVIASISTLIFNANPLMRFDGYYIMTDWIEVPNLCNKSRSFIGYQVKRLIFGSDYQDASMARLPLPRRRFGLFYFYAVASYIYGYFVIYRLTRFMAPHLAPFGLQKLATWFSVTALTAWVVMPLWSFMKSLQITRNDWGPGGRMRRLGIVGGCALAFFTIFCFVPVPLVIKRNVAVELASPEDIRPDYQGFVDKILVKEGDKVPPGGAVAQLSNRDVQQDLVEATAQLAVAEAAVQRALAEDKPDELREAQPIVDRMKKRLADAQQSVDRLTLRSKLGGTVLTHDLQLLLHRELHINDVFCQVAPLDEMRIVIPLNEKQVRWVRKGQPVEIKSYAYPGIPLHGTIAADPVILVGEDMPAAFSARRHGDVPTAFDRSGKEIPLERTYEAEIQVDNRQGLLREGMTGRAKIDAGRYPWGRLVLQSLLDLVSLDYRF